MHAYIRGCIDSYVAQEVIEEEKKRKAGLAKKDDRNLLEKAVLAAQTATDAVSGKLLLLSCFMPCCTTSYNRATYLQLSTRFFP